MKNKNKKERNPEILREESEKHKVLSLADEDGGYRLYPHMNSMGMASATESTGLIQVIPLEASVMDVYDDVYSYRQRRPIAREE